MAKHRNAPKTRPQMKASTVILACLVVCAGSLSDNGPTFAQESSEAYLPLDGQIDEAGQAVRLIWDTANPLRVGNVAINRRLFGARGITSWQGIAPKAGPVVHFDDTTIRPGIAYEYQVLRTARDIVDIGYWVTGVEIPAVEARGRALVLVDQSIAEDIAPRLDRFMLDLTGAGWQVIRHDVARGVSGDPVRNLAIARDIRGWIGGTFAQNPQTPHALILAGHVPVITSGRTAPDGHDATAVPTDLFYADVDGTWPDDGAGVLRPSQVPSHRIEMQVGRIDFAGVSGGNRAREVALLRSYFDKNHHWRHGMIGDLRKAYGQSDHLIGERMGLRNIVGPDAIAKGGHHDVGETQPWLWGVDFGDWNGENYATNYANKAVFALNFGSGKHKFHGWNNPMTALLAQPFYPTAVGWGGRPAWWIHGMGLGETIGGAHMRTVNNGRARGSYRLSMDYLPTGSYLWRNPVWVNLLGDPTTHAFPLAPPRAVKVGTGAGVTLSWQASPSSPDTLGYKVYRAGPEGLGFKSLTPKPITATQFTDPDPIPGARYMVRAYGLKKVHAGSFFTLSQGAFAAAGRPALRPLGLTATTAPATPVILNFPDDGSVYSFVHAPTVGVLEKTPEGWQYTSPVGFIGDVTLGFSRFDGLSGGVGVYSVRISGP